MESRLLHFVELGMDALRRWYRSLRNVRLRASGQGRPLLHVLWTFRWCALFQQIANANVLGKDLIGLA